jgi:hypothetical protein
MKPEQPPMILGLILFFSGLILWVVSSHLITKLGYSSNKFLVLYSTLISNTGIALMAICLLAAAAGLIIVLLHKWWLAILLFFIAMPRIVKHVAD